MSSTEIKPYETIDPKDLPMDVYEVKPDDCSFCAFNTLEAALQEAKTLLEMSDTGDSVTIKKSRMTQRKFENLCEFQGY